MTIQEITDKLILLKARENELYSEIDDVQADIMDLEQQRREKEFWATKKTYTPAPVNTEPLTDEQMKAIILFNSDKRFTITE